VKVKLMIAALGLNILIACSTTLSTDVTNLSDLTLCDNVLNYNGRSPALQNARTEELNERSQDCSAFVHLKRDNLEISERLNQNRRRKPFGKSFPR